MTGFKGQYLGAAPKVDMLKRDRRVSVISVPCPSCKQPVGERCINAAGQVSMQHSSRRRMALRAER